MPMQWDQPRPISVRYRCGFCQASAFATQGLAGDMPGPGGGRTSVRIAICPGCGAPTILMPNKQIPAFRIGADVGHITDEQVQMMYDEARDCTAAGAHTAAVLCCRKLLMHLAVSKGAEPGKNFAHYVDHLVSQGYVPPDARGWVDHIRKLGNQANHELVMNDAEQSRELVSFVEMLLKLIYEFPARVRPQEASDE